MVVYLHRRTTASKCNLLQRIVGREGFEPPTYPPRIGIPVQRLPLCHLRISLCNYLSSQASSSIMPIIIINPSEVEGGGIEPPLPRNESSCALPVKLTP